MIIEDVKKKLFKYGMAAFGGVLLHVGVQDAVIQNFVSAGVEVVVGIGAYGIPILISMARDRLLKKHFDLSSYS